MELCCLQKQIALIINFICMVSAFSVPKAKRQQKLSANPGPGQYDAQTSPKVVKPEDPKYSFGKDGRRDSVSKVPGPGSYEQKGSFVKQSTPKYSLQGRKEDSTSKHNVGPGQYDPSQRYSKENSPSYSLYGRSNSEMKGIKLGPGQYDIKGEIQMKKSGYHFSKEARDYLEKRNVPGPGTYDYENAVFKYGSKQDPSYGFGSRLHDPSGLKVPGPGSYENKSAVYSKIGGIMSRQMRNSYADSKTPGPGNYNGDSSKVKGKEPSWSLSKSPRDQMSKSTLGPGAYEHDKNYKQLVTTNKGYNFGSENKLKYDINNVPGPGQYDGKLLSSKHGIKIASRLQNPEGLKVPGPGSYENQKYDYQSWLKGGGKYSLGKSNRDGFDKRNVPGPGAYDSKDHDTSGKVTFSKDQKLKRIKNPNPGPGQYELKPFFADVPSYLLPNKN